MRAWVAARRVAIDGGHGILLGPALWIFVAWTAVDASIAIYLGLYGVNGASSVLLVIGFAAFLLAGVASRGRAASVTGAATALLVAHLALRAIVPFRAEEPAPTPYVQALALVGLGLMLIGALLERQGRSGWTIVLATIIGLGVVARAAIIAYDIAPPFDVPLVQEAAAAALRSGSDPYLTRVYDSGYPYLPVAALAAMLGSLAGDARWAILGGDVMTIVGIVVVARRLAAPRPLGLLLGALWTWWSGGLYVVWQGFPEPILTGFMALGVALMVGSQRKTVLAGVLLGLSLGTKQFAFGLLPYLGVSAKGRIALVTALTLGLILIVPFAAWHPAEFAEGTFWSHLSEPGRPYALNLLSWPSAQLDIPLPIVLGAALVVGLWCSRRVGNSDGAWLAGSGGLLLTVFAFNRIAFVNYYAIPLVVMLLLLLMHGRSNDDAPHSA